MPTLVKLSLLTLTIVLAFAPVQADAEGVEWLRSAEQAADLARKTGKPILIYVRSENCHYCDLMQKNVWQDPETVAIIMREFVPLKLTREDNKEAVEAMKVKGFPSTLIFSAERTYVGRLDGYVTSEKFLDSISSVRTATAQTALVR